MKVEKSKEASQGISVKELKEGLTYISAGSVSQLNPTVYLCVICNGMTCLCNLSTGQFYSTSELAKYVEVEAKVVWGFFK